MMQHTFFKQETSNDTIIKIMVFSSFPEAQSPQIRLLLNIYLIIKYTLLTEKTVKKLQKLQLEKVLQQIAKKKRQ